MNKAQDLSAALGFADAVKAAKNETGLDDFGDHHFLEAAQAFIELVQSDIRFSEAGILNLKVTVHRWLVNRLRFQRDILAHPDILEEDVSDPIMILGMPRTGTTKLQRMISADPAMQKLSFWRLLNPAPFSFPSAEDDAARIAIAEQVEQAMQANSDMMTSHETSTHEADEDSYLTISSFEYPLLYALYPSRAYLDHVWSQSRQPAHDYMKQLLQYLQWQDGGRKGRRWVLKNPGAIGCLPDLHRIFPQATYVHSSRDMLEVLPSYCRLMESALTPLVEDLDLNQHGQNAIDFWSHEVALYQRDRERLGSALNFIDAPYKKIVGEPLEITRLIYDRAGLSLTETAKAAMQEWMSKNGQHKHGKAVYSLERYGMTPDAIAAAFPDSYKT